MGIAPSSLPDGRASDREAHARVRRRYVDCRHGHLHARLTEAAETAAPPLLCIHMSPMTGRVFEPLLAAIGRDRRAIAFDTPGFGMSDPPPAPPSIEDYAADLLAGLDAMGVTGTFDLLGYHTGSMTSVALALLAPERVRRIVMISAPIFPEDERATFKAHYGPRPAEADGSHILRRWRSFLYHHLRPGVSVAAVNEAFKDALLGGEREWWGHRAAFAYDLAGSLSAVAQPVLVINPGDDLDVQTRRAEGLRDNIRIVEAPGWGHGFLAQHTRDAERLMRRFLDAPDGAEFSNIAVPPSAAGPRYPERVGSFPPGAITNAASAA